MRAAVYVGQGKVEVREVPIPEIQRGEVLVRVETCGVCATDIKKVEYGLQKPPRIYGHEMAGEIVQISSGVQSWKVGDRVAVHHHYACHRCYFCKRGEFAQCPLYKKTGTTAGYEPAGGGFAQYIRVMPWIVKGGMVRIPKSIHYDEASFLEPLNTCLKGVNRLELGRGSRVLVFGQGPIGLMFTQLIRSEKSHVGALDFFESRRKLARSLGASWALDPRDPKADKKIQSWTERRGADAAVIAVPSESAFQQALKLIRPGGRVLLFAHTKRGDHLSVDAATICVDEKMVLGSYSSSIDLIPKVAKKVFTHQVKVRPLISHHMGLDDVAKAFHLASHPTEFSLKILIHPWKS